MVVVVDAVMHCSNGRLTTPTLRKWKDEKSIIRLLRGPERLCFGTKTNRNTEPGTRNRNQGFILIQPEALLASLFDVFVLNQGASSRKSFERAASD